VTTRIDRIFSPTLLVMGLGFLLAGLMSLATAVYLILKEKRVSAVGVIFGILLILVGGSSLKRSLAEGCIRCGKRFDDICSSLPIASYELLVRALAEGEARDFERLAELPPAPPSEKRAVLRADFCPVCSRVCRASAATEEWTGRRWYAEDPSPPTVLFDERAQALVAVLKQRELTGEVEHDAGDRVERKARDSAGG
jgi:hypothetical protein